MTDGEQFIRDGRLCGWSRAALDRITELDPELLREFGSRPMLVERMPRWRAPTTATTFEDVERWLLARGVYARIGSVTSGRISFELALLAEYDRDVVTAERVRA